MKNIRAFSLKEPAVMFATAAALAAAIALLAAGCSGKTDSATTGEASGKATTSQSASAPGNNPSAAPARTADIDYAALDFGKIADAKEAATKAVASLAGDDAAVVKAWASALDNLSKVRAEVDRTGKVLASADLLNISKITNGTPNAISDQFVARRKIANDNSFAINDWQNAVHDLTRVYTAALVDRSVPMPRAQGEIDKMKRALIDKARAEVDRWETAKKVAQEYNYAVNAMQNLYTYRSADYNNAIARQRNSGNNSVVTTQPLPWEVKNAPNPAVIDSQKKFDHEVALIEELKQSAQH